MKRRYSYPVNGVSAGTQIFGGLASFIGGVALVVQAANHSPAILEIGALVVYSVSLLMMFGVSALYHLKGTELLRRLDHASIYVLIAGSYTPVFILGVKGWIGDCCSFLVWCIASVGIIIKIFWFKRSERWSIWSYIILGWFGCFFGKIVWQSLEPYQILGFLAGGVLYTVGAYIYNRNNWIILEGFVHAHEIWHGFVLAGVTAHYWMIFTMSS